MRRNTLITLGLSTAFGALAIVLARGWINTAVSTQYEQTRPAAAAQAVTNIKTVPVLVADMSLQFGDRLTPQNVRIAEFPADAVPEGSFSDIDSLFSNPDVPTVVLGQMAANEPILGFKLSGPGGRATLSALLGENMRAVSLRVNDVSGVAGFVQPGDTVDVLFVQEMEDTKGASPQREFMRNSERSKTNYQNMTLVQNIKVLGSGQRSETVNNQVVVVKTVTVEVTPRQAQKLALAMRVGELSLSLRQAGSQALNALEVMKGKDLRADRAAPKHGAKMKTKRAYTPKPRSKNTSGVASIIVVRDGKVKQVKVFKDTDTTAKLAGG